MAKNDTAIKDFRTTKPERVSFWMYLFGQNLFIGLVAFNMQTFLSDVGITAATIAAILFVTRLWDAVNDPLLGIIIDKVRFKKGRFMPWLRIAMPALTITSILFFMLPTGASPVIKVIWAIVAYVSWDISYTICDVPIHVLPTSMTDNSLERGHLLTIGRTFALLGMVFTFIAIPILQARLGWLITALILIGMAAILLFPLCFKGKERRIVRPENNIKIKQMIKYVVRNKYLLIFYIALFVSGITSFGHFVTIFFARINLGNQDLAALMMLSTFIPLLVVGFVMPRLIKKVDKFKIYFFCNLISAFVGIIRYFAGFSDLTIFFTLAIIHGIFTCVILILPFTFTPDFLEYGTYHTGERAEGVAMSIQTFFGKLISSVAGPLAMLIIAAFGFIEGEYAIQPDSVLTGLWLCITIFPAIGTLLSLIILRFYKLRDKDVKVMAKYNNGEISKEEAEEHLSAKYGSAASLTQMKVTENE